MMKKIVARLFLILFVSGLLIAGIHACSDDYGDYGDVYGGVSAQLP